MGGAAIFGFALLAGRGIRPELQSRRSGLSAEDIHIKGRDKHSIACSIGADDEDDLREPSTLPSRVV